MIKLVIVIILISTCAFAQTRQELRAKLIENHYPLTDWKVAKHFLLKELFIQKDSKGYFLRDVYCHNIIRENVSPETMPNGSVINIEHTWPQSKFTKKKSFIILNLKTRTKKSRNRVRKVNRDPKQYNSKENNNLHKKQKSQKLQSPRN